MLNICVCIFIYRMPRLPDYFRPLIMWAMVLLLTACYNAYRIKYQTCKCGRWFNTQHTYQDNMSTMRCMLECSWLFCTCETYGSKWQLPRQHCKHDLCRLVYSMRPQPKPPGIAKCSVARCVDLAGQAWAWPLCNSWTHGCWRPQTGSCARQWCWGMQP